MAMQTGVSTSKVLVLVGAGLTGSVILRGGGLSDVLLQLQELIKGVNEGQISPNRYDTSLLAAQIRQLAQEIRELTSSGPVTIFNGNSDSSGKFASYIMPAAALGAMGYCYMWWKGWSFSDVMFVTKRNMANAVANVSKQLEQVSAALASTKRHLTLKLENLDEKMVEQKEVSKLIMNEVNGVKFDLSQIGFDIETIQNMVSGLEGKIGLIESKQDVTNSGLWYLCQSVGGIKEGHNAKLLQDGSVKPPPEHAPLSYEEKSSLKGLQFIVDTTEAVEAVKYFSILSSSMKSSRKDRFSSSYTSVTYTIINRKHDQNAPPSHARTTEIPVEASSDEIPVPIDGHIPTSLQSPESAAAVKIQSAYRAHLVRRFVKRIITVNSEADRLQRLIQRQETVDAIRNDEREKVRMNEALMALLLRLDSVPGIYPAVRELRRATSRRVVELQEILDAVADSKVHDAEGFLTNWDQMIADMEEDVCRRRGGDEMERFCAEKLGFRCFERFLRGV
ncbi:hypothetical protein NE237_031868 [Protea cynaroides]|uniref:BAG domain-containing protein n=1 Tax=Protea cynaroides TaxID=273540 RepID=A0A9Q0L300_9MAGN|nr:hypothetical protein NE237_031868 [Protea cynaroides]